MDRRVDQAERTQRQFTRDREGVDTRDRAVLDCLERRVAFSLATLNIQVLILFWCVCDSVC